MKRKDIVNLIIIVAAILLFTYVFLFSKSQRREYSKLEAEGVTDTAIIVREFIGAKRKLYFEYIFFIDNEKYNGFLQYSPSNGTISIGDSFLVRYLPRDPDEINKLIQNKDHRLKRIKK